MDELELRAMSVFPEGQIRRHPFKLVVDFERPFILPGRHEPIAKLYLRYDLGPFGTHAYRECPETRRLVRIAGSIWVEIERCIRDVSAHQLVAARRRLVAETAS